MKQTEKHDRKERVNMHYKNGREAKSGDIVVVVEGRYTKVGVLHSLLPSGYNSCNALLAHLSDSQPVTVKDCLHIEDVEAATIPNSLKVPPTDNAHVEPGCERKQTCGPFAG